MICNHDENIIAVALPSTSFPNLQFMFRYRNRAALPPDQIEHLPLQDGSVDFWPMYLAALPSPGNGRRFIGRHDPDLHIAGHGAKRVNQQLPGVDTPLSGLMFADAAHQEAYQPVQSAR
jgi:hypothetical protein